MVKVLNLNIYSYRATSLIGENVCVLMLDYFINVNEVKPGYHIQTSPLSSSIHIQKLGGLHSLVRDKICTQLVCWRS